MIIVEKLHIDNIPTLHVVKQNLQSETLPLVLFIHGFTSAKENNLHYAYLLAEKGYRVVLPEAIYHGERSKETKGSLDYYFWEIVLSTLNEVKEIKDYFTIKQLIDPERIGLAGTSMGGIITLGALKKYEWIKVAVSLMGMPYYEKLAVSQIDHVRAQRSPLPVSDDEIASLISRLKEADLSNQPETLNHRPLLFWHGVKDPVVPYNYTYDFYHSIKPLYSEVPDRLKFISDSEADHKVSREGVLATIDWFDKHL